MNNRKDIPPTIPKVIRRIPATTTLSLHSLADSRTRIMGLSHSTTSKLIQNSGVQHTLTAASNAHNISQERKKLREQRPLPNSSSVERARSGKQRETLTISEPYDPRHVNVGIVLERSDKYTPPQETTSSAVKKQNRDVSRPYHPLRLNPLGPKIIITPPRPSPVPTELIPSLSRPIPTDEGTSKVSKTARRCYRDLSGRVCQAVANFKPKHTRRDSLKTILMKVTKKSKRQSADSMARSQQASACRELAQVRAVCEHLEKEVIVLTARANQQRDFNNFHKNQWEKEKAKVAALEQKLREKTASRNLSQDQTGAAYQALNRPEVTDLAGKEGISQKAEDPRASTSNLRRCLSRKPLPKLPTEEEIDMNDVQEEVIFHELSATASHQALRAVYVSENGPSEKEEVKVSSELSPAASIVDLRPPPRQESEDRHQQQKHEENKFLLQAALIEDLPDLRFEEEITDTDHGERYRDLPYGLPELDSLRGSFRDIFSGPEIESLSPAENKAFRLNARAKDNENASPTSSDHSDTLEQGIGTQRPREIVYRFDSPRIVTTPAVFRVPLSDTSGMPPSPTELLLDMAGWEWDSIPRLSLDD